MPPTIAVAEHFAGLVADSAAKHGVPLRLVRISRDGGLLDDAAGLDVIVGADIKRPDLRRLLLEHPSVRWVAVFTAGADPVMVPEVVERGIPVTRIRHVHDVFVAEFAMAVILGACKRLPEVVLAQQRKEWVTFQPPLLTGQTLV